MAKPTLFEEIDPCSPPFWARSGHAQTILGHLIPSLPVSEHGKRLEISLADGDRLVANLLESDSNTVVYLFHGLAGDIAAGYIQRTARVCRELGYTVLLVNHRGCGEGVGLARHPYHSGRAEDLSATIALGRERFPRRRHVAVGFSLSGNALLLLLSGKRGVVQPDAAISVNAPIALEKAALLLQRGMNRIYDLRFVRDCRREVRCRLRADPELPRYRIPWTATLYDFDAIYTAPASGFQGREDYYRSCSTQDLLRLIRVPTVLMTAKDDPFVDYRDYLEAELPSAVTLHLEEHGGHMGYLTRQKTQLGSRRWLDYALSRHIRRLAG